MVTLQHANVKNVINESTILHAVGPTSHLQFESYLGDLTLLKTLS